MADAHGASEERPPHHRPGGGFRDPWPPHPDADPSRSFLRWRRERAAADLPPDPDPAAIPRGRPDPARPRAAPGDLVVTWIGHATFLLQVGGLNLLTDPVWSRRASPLPWVGPARFLPPALPLEALPPLDGVLLSHDHYDHLDAPTVRALVRRFGPDLPWLTPLGYRGWLERRGVRAVVELDWWGEAELGGCRVAAAPARHWTRRALASNRRLWCSWAVRPPAGHGVLFVGDSGYGPFFGGIGARLGPFRACILPVGAYDPRWFMAPAHMDPEEAVRAFLDLGGHGGLVGSHWGTFRLTDEDPLEPPDRTRRAWRAAGLDPGHLHLPGVGGTVSP